MVESIFYGAYSAPIEEYAKMQPNEVIQGERYRVGVARAALPLLGWARNIARLFPPGEIARKVTPEWLIARGGKRYPEAVQVWRDCGEKGERWLKRQSQEIASYLTGSLIYDTGQQKMIPVPTVRRRR